MTNEQSKGHGGLTGDIYAWTLTVKKSPAAAIVWFTHLSNDITVYQCFGEGFGPGLPIQGASGSPDYWTVCYTDPQGNLWVTNDFMQRDSGPNTAANLELLINSPAAGSTVNTGTLTFTWGTSTQVINLNFTVYYKANP